MAKETINNGETLGVIRGKLNSMFTNLYSFIDITGTLGIGNGGTGATTASGARTNLDVEQAFSKNTAFNKNFGTTAGTVLEGSKDAEYAKLASANTFTDRQVISSNDVVLKLNSSGNYGLFDLQENVGSKSIRVGVESSGGILGTTSSDNLKIITGNATRVLVDTSGNVGIGTTSPGSKAHISCGNIDGLRVQSSNSGFLEWGKTGGDRWRWANDFSGPYMQLLSNDGIGGSPSTNVLSIYRSTGNVGINETSPDYKLDVNGSFGITPGIGTTVTPVDNGDLTFETVSNTQVRLKLKGSDGVVRSTTLTLS